MAETIFLAYYGTSNGGYRALVSTYDTAVTHVLIHPTTRLLGASIGSGPQYTAFVVPDSTWTTIAAVVDGGGVSLYANGSYCGQFSAPYALPSVSHIGNGLDHVATTVGLAPSLTLAPSLSLAPASATWAAASFSNGTIDEVQRYNYALSPGEIANISASITLYPVLPSAPLQDGFSDTRSDPVLRSSLEGAIARRLRATVAAGELSLSFYLSREQTVVLDWFYDTATRYGTIPFNFTDPTTGASIEAMLLSQPRHNRAGNGYVSSVAMQVLT